MLHAVLRNNFDDVQMLLEAGSDPTHHTAFQQAVLLGYTDIVKLFLDDSRTDPAADNNSAIKTAAGCGYTEIVTALLSHTNVTGMGDAPLTLAICGGHVDVVKVLIKWISITTYMIRQAVTLNHEILIILLNHVDNFAMHIDVAFSAAYSNLAVTKVLLDYIAHNYDAIEQSHTTRNQLMNQPINFAINKAIFEACKYGHEDVVRVLLASGRVNPGARDNALFRCAVKRGHTEIVRMLIADDRVDPQAKDNEALTKATFSDNTEIVEIIIARIATPGFTYAQCMVPVRPSCVAASARSITIMKLFLKSWPHGYERAFNAAVKSNNIDMVKLLYPHIDPTSRNHVVGHAACLAQLDILQLFLDDPLVDVSVEQNRAIVMVYESDVANKNAAEMLIKCPRFDPSRDDYHTFVCTIRLHPEIALKMLTYPHIDPSADNNCALTTASVHGLTDIVKLLLSDPRVDPSVNDNYAIEISTISGYTDIVEMLLERLRGHIGVSNYKALSWA